MGKSSTQATRLSTALALAFLLAMAAFSRPVDYGRHLLFELTAQSDVIASGSIVRVHGETFEFAVDEVLVGDVSTRALEVVRFEDWTCHHRWTEYAVGQRLLLFLRRDEHDAMLLNVIGAGDEGEMPFVGDHVIAENSNSFRVHGYEVGLHEAAGAPMTGTALPFAELSEAIRGFRSACSWSGTPWSDSSKIGPRESLEDVRRFARTSTLARHLYEEASTSRSWILPSSDVPVSLDCASMKSIVGREVEFAEQLGKPLRPRNGYDSGFGRALARPGDIDGDGIEDLIVGAPWENRSGHHNGAMWVLFLDSVGQVKALREIRGQPGGVPANEFTKGLAAIAPLGDLDGDSIPDIVVGAPNWDGAEDGGGGVWVLFLKRDGSVSRAVEIGHSDVLRSLGVRAESGIGSSFASLGDLDRDGAIEIAVGQNPRLDFGRENGRAVYIVSLGRDGTPLRAQRIHSHKDGFADDYSDFGDALAALGDVNHDGTPDLAIADSSDDDGGWRRGAVWVIFFAPDGSIRGRQKISDWSGDFEGHLTDGTELGKSLTGAGDIDGDGVPDLLVGSHKGLWTVLLNADGTVRSHKRVEIVDPSREQRVRVGASITCSGRGADGTESMVAVGGTLGEAAPFESLIWWLRLDSEGRLVPW
jgi:hypothetical protein